MIRFTFRIRHNGYIDRHVQKFVDFHECYQFIRDVYPFHQIVSIVESP